MTSKTLYASLIGINAYQQSPLDGCIRDILDVDLFLRGFTKQQTDEPIAYKPAYFLSPDDNIDQQDIRAHEALTGKPLPYEPATFKNISTLAFDHLKQAKKGDIVLLYYSGHGSQTEAPEVFWHTKPDRQNETIVCVDSRDPNNPAARDLIDKELGFLLWDTLEGKDVHCLVIMDCCHSGNNTRGLSSAVKFRHMGSARNKIPLEQYIGFQEDSGYYKMNGGKCDVEVARYVHLAAALDFEKAQDGLDGGLFTRKLLEGLRAGGTGKSYRQLMQSVAISVNNRASQQTPVAFAENDADLNLPFLGGSLLPYRPTFSVRHDTEADVWKLYGGAMLGLVPQTKITIIGEDKEVTVIEVMTGESTLDPQETATLDKDKEYEGVIKQLPTPRFRIGISDNLQQDAEKLEELKNEYTRKRPVYYTIDFTPDVPATYLVRLTTDGKFILTFPADDVPLFKREADAGPFLNAVDAIGLWRGALEQQNANTAFSRNELDIEIGVIEGIKLTEQKLKDRTLAARIADGDEVIARYKDGNQPGLRVRIKINENSSRESCYVGALYLSSDFGVFNNYIEKGAKLDRNNWLEVRFPLNDNRYLTIPLRVNKELKKYNINEITEYLRIFVSEKVVDLSVFEQQPLQLDRGALTGTKSGGPGLESESDTDWAVFTTKIRIIGEDKERLLIPNQTSEFADFTITAPASLSAKAVAVTGNDIQAKLSKLNLRTRDSEASQVVQMIIPRDDMWGDVLTEDVAFSQGMNTPSNNGLSALEIFPGTAQEVVLKEGEELLIQPKVAAGTRSIDDDDLEDTIIPYAFDVDSELWYPIGYSDEQGVIHISTLPKETPGVLSNPNEAALTRSLGGSIKLFFKKIFKRKERNSALVLYHFKPDGSWEEVTRDLGKMNAVLKQKPNGRAILLTHGFTGDTRHIVEALKEAAEFPGIVDFVLTYDYENLATPIKKAAQDLHGDLTAIGFGDNGMPKLTILAHSQGGLLTRWLVEQVGGSKYVRSVILVGVASAGTHFATLGAGVLSLITHAINGPPVLKLAITGLSFLLKKLELDPARTLKDTKPGSDFINGLAASAVAPGVAYMVIGGDVSLLKGYNGDDGFLRKVGVALVRGVLFPTLKSTLFDGKPNDFVVSLESMQKITGFAGGDNVSIVASNHLAYFREKLIQQELIAFIKK